MVWEEVGEGPEGSSSSLKVVKLYFQILGYAIGEMPPPRSRIRIVMPGVVESISAALPSVSGSAVSIGVDCDDAGGDGEHGIDEAAMVTSIGSRSFPRSTVARKAFLRSSVRMYSRWVGTCARRVSDCPLIITLGLTPYFSSQISPTKDSLCRTMSAGLSAVSITPMCVDVSWWS